MSTEAFEQFRARLAADPGLQQQCLALMQSRDVPAVLALAQALGHPFRAEEAVAALDGAELSDLELEMVAGGSAGHKGGPGCTCAQCSDPRAVLGT